MNPAVFHGDCAVVLKGFADDSFDSVCTDPPYELTTGKKGGSGEASLNLDSPAGRSRISTGGGFMGKHWDSTGIAFNPALWAEVLRVLKPGGHLVAFGGTRTYHRMAVAIEDAGFEIRDSLHWIYGCLPADTEVLTEYGWKPGIDITTGESVAQWDAETGHITLAPVQETFRAPWDGSMRVLRNADTDQVLTPNHRVWLRRKHHIRTGVREWGSWEVMPAENIGTGIPVRLPVAGEHDGPGIGGEDYAALLGWVWTEGGFDLSGHGVRIYQSSVNASKVTEIATLMDRSGPHKRYDHQRKYKYVSGEREYTAVTWFFSGELAKKVRADLPGKRPAYSLLWRMTQDEKRAFLRAAMLGDGTGWGTKSAQFYQKYEDDLIWFQTLLALTGRAGKVTMRSNRPGGQVSLRKRDTTELQQPHLKRAHDEDYLGEVWCIRMPTGAFVARRNGKVFITGNSGFPKSLDVSKAIDKAAGAEREVVGSKSAGQSSLQRVARVEQGYRENLTACTPEEIPVTVPATPAAARWDGWGTALKPAHEPIILARKPLTGTVAANVLEHGTGGLNITGCRVSTSDTWEASGKQSAPGSSYSGSADGSLNISVSSAHEDGRWPPNILLSHSPGCTFTGTRKVHSRPWDISGNEPSAVTDIVYAKRKRVPWKSHGDADGMETVTSWACTEGCPVSELDRQSGGSVTTQVSADRPLKRQDNEVYGKGLGSILASNTHSDSGGASRFFPQFSWSPEYDFPYLYNAKAARKERPSVDGISHVTVKPLALMRWLTRLVTPPGGICLDLFAGTGVTGQACLDEGFRCVLIEREADYVKLIRARMNARHPSLFDE